VWKSNPPFGPRRVESPALKAGKVTGPLSPPLFARFSEYKAYILCANFTHRRFGLWCYWGAIGNQRNGLVKVRNSEVRMPFRLGEAALRTVAQQFRERGQIHSFLPQTGRQRMPAIMPAKRRDPPKSARHPGTNGHLRATPRRQRSSPPAHFHFICPPSRFCRILHRKGLSLLVDFVFGLESGIPWCCVLEYCRRTRLLRQHDLSARLTGIEVFEMCDALMVKLCFLSATSPIPCGRFLLSRGCFVGGGRA
jgi:hypothetical protein